MANKNRILHLLRFLQDHSDEERAVSTAQIRSALREKGCPVTTETLRDDIAALRDVGYDIVVNESNGLTTTYSYIDRPLDAPELQILIDAVSSSQFISHTRSKQLISRLTAIAGPSHREELKPGIAVCGSVKTPNSQLPYTVQKIQQAIRSDRKITFQYFRFDLNKARVPRHDGKWYVISPYVTLWKHERYFLVGWSDEREKAVVFRIDRMGIPKLTRQRRTPAPEDLDVRDYTERIFSMYDEGEMETVTLRCRRHMIDHIVDYFGEDVELFNVTEETFDVNVRVCASATFFAWVMGYAGDMTIAGPERVQEAYVQLLQRGIADVRLRVDAP
ncbi:MAG: WYL domain-containing protein [Clostridia bacterium]|nr:WYL domain-containing protein [Clostridia bacterium]